jgi:tRNA G18 (ribose-2'-O)-methylase SpoU
MYISFMKKDEVCLIMHDIRSAENVGSMFRTADSVGINKIFITGYTPAPKDKFERVNNAIAKTALGAESYIPWQKEDDVLSLLKKLKKDKYTIVAIEQNKDSVDYKDIKINYPVAFIVGNEVSGISQDIIDQCDYIAEIPMKGQKESLNVSVAFGIAVFRILNV